MFFSYLKKKMYVQYYENIVNACNYISLVYWLLTLVTKRQINSLSSSPHEKKRRKIRYYKYPLRLSEKGVYLVQVTRDFQACDDDCQGDGGGEVFRL